MATFQEEITRRHQIRIESCMHQYLTEQDGEAFEFDALHGVADILDIGFDRCRTRDLEAAQGALERMIVKGEVSRQGDTVFLLECFSPAP
jgi:hypothetical protein